MMKAEHDLPGTEGGRRERVREGGRGWGRGAGERNDPNNVCTCELKKRVIKKGLEVPLLGDRGQWWTASDFFNNLFENLTVARIRIVQRTQYLYYQESLFYLICFICSLCICMYAGLN
jgi:hypothetical protein